MTTRRLAQQAGAAYSRLEQRTDLPSEGRSVLVDVFVHLLSQKLGAAATAMLTKLVPIEKTPLGKHLLKQGHAGGLAEGRVEGLAQGETLGATAERTRVVHPLRRSGMTPAAIAKAVAAPVDEVMRLLKPKRA